MISSILGLLLCLKLFQLASMMDLIRDSSLGQLIRYATGDKYLQYPEERADFQCPLCYDKIFPTDSSVAGDTSSEKDVDLAEGDEKFTNTPAEKSETNQDAEHRPERTLSRASTRLAQATMVADLERAVTPSSRIAANRLKSQPIVPTKTADGTVLVDWYTTGPLNDDLLLVSILTRFQMTRKIP
jgi:DHA1 family multidrug resistance protein-like MFS transporter